MKKISPCFKSPQMEHAFRQHTLGEDKKRAGIVFCLAILAATVFFILNYQSLGSGPLFTELAIVRGLFLALVVIFLIVVSGIRDEKKLDLLLLGFCMAVAFTNYYVTSYRPGGYTPAAMSDIIVILLLYLLVPVRLMYKSIPAFLKQMYQAYPADYTVVQLNDTEPITSGLLDAVSLLRKQGYKFGFDDFEGLDKTDDLCGLADYITIDVLDRDENELIALAGIARRTFPNAALIAKRIEEYDLYRMAKELGFTYFQGYFFKRPRTDSGEKISGSQISKLKIISILQDEDAEFKKIEAAIATDVSIVYRLLVYVNSPYLGVRKKVDSLGDALVIMGLEPLKKWLQIIMLTDLAPLEKPQELVLTSARRACFMELLARENGYEQDANSLFILGLCSLLDALLDHPMSELTGQLFLNQELENALLGKPSNYLHWLMITLHLEQARWKEAEKIAKALSLDTDQLALIHGRAFDLAREFFKIS